MGEYTHETLRAMARRCLWWVQAETLEQFDAHADAWQKRERYIEALERAVVTARFAALPDVERVEVIGTEAVIHITGTRYDDAQMDRLIGAEMEFLTGHPGCHLSFRYVPEAVAGRKEEGQDGG